MKDTVKRLIHTYSPQHVRPVADWVLERGVEIQQIPGPTFEESGRAEFVTTYFDSLTLSDVQQDDMHNVYGLLPGENRDAPGVMLMAHTDTVFPAGTDLALRYEDGVIYGPGLGDNSIGVAGMLGVAHMLRQEDITPACDIWFVATSREEGLGNLDGARLAYDTLRDKVSTVINVEGLAYGYVYRAGIAVRRLHIVARAAGGHSWLHYGRASAIHALMQLGAKISALQPPENPRTTYNIGMIEGGQSINSIATEAGMWLDLRSERTASLIELENTVRAHIDEMQSDDIAFEIAVVGDRPAGEIDTTHPLIMAALAALNANGVRGMLQVGSTDGNIPLSHSCPTVTVGVTRGGNAHRLDEFIEVAPIADGMSQLIGLTLAAATYQTTSER